MPIPAEPLPEDALFARLEAYRQHDVDARGGRVWSYSYHASPEIDRIAERAYLMFLGVNGLDPTAYPSVLRFENEVVGALAAHLGGGTEAAGSFTSGGTESILLAVKTARDWAREHRPDVKRPQMIVPVTAHAAFHKAGHYLGVEVVSAPIDPATLRADVAAVGALVTERTILLVGSAPSYAHGVIDPIPALGALARDRGLLLHVDACIGGFLLPYFRRLGTEVPPFDLSVPGVTSISVDLHKYACTPKGASVVLYRDKALRRHQIFTCSRWTGYSVVNPTVQSTKSGGPLAAAWAVLQAVGDAGYLRLARELRDATAAIVAGVEAIPGLRVLGPPDMTLIAFAAEAGSVLHVADEMKQRGWHVQPQLAFGGAPATIHLTVAPQNVPQVEPLLADLRDSVAAARSLTSGALLGALQAAGGVEALAQGGLQQAMALAGVAEGELPERMAPLNEVLEALPTPLTEELLGAFVNDLFCAAPSA